VYTPLSEAPDPYPLLEASIDSHITAEETVPRITEENQRLQKQVSSLTSQLETAESSLQTERSARQELERDVEGKVKEVEKSWEAVLSEKGDNWASKERSLEEKVSDQDRLLKELKASYAVSQRLNQGGESEDTARSTATAAELEIVSSELERTNLRLAEVENRNESLRVELAQAASGGSAGKNAVEDDPKYLRLQSENSSLMRRLENWRFEKESEKRKWEGNMRALEREVNSLKKDRDGLREKMHKWSDYENLKKELEVLKVIHFLTPYMLIRT
jgi:homeobox protein cut-like